MRLRLALLGLLVLLLLSPLAAPAEAQPAYLPHEDPHTATRTRDAYPWMVYYGNILGALLSQDVDAARALLRELSYASLPTGMEAQIGTLNRQLLRVVDGLEGVVIAIREMPGLLATNRVAEASTLSWEARLTLLDLEARFPDLSLAGQTVADRLGVTAAPPGSRERAAFESVAQKTQQLVDLYRQALADLEAMWDAAQAMAIRLEPTLLTIDVAPDSVFLGEEIRVSGQLVADDRPLAGRFVRLYSNLDTRTAAVTRRDGSYVADFEVPYVYVPGMVVWALYLPEGADLAGLQASQSPRVRVELRFHETKLEVDWPQVAYPGLPMTLRGEIGSDAETQPASRRLRILFDGKLLASADVPTSFQIEVEPPAEATLGTHKLVAQVAPYSRYASTSADSELELEVLPTTIQVRTPRLALAPWRLPVSGKLTSSRGPLDGARIQATMKGRSVVASSGPGGDYSASLRLPLSLTLMGPQKLVVAADPKAPWYANVAAERSVFVFNLASVGLLLAAVSAAGLVALRRRRVPEVATAVEQPVEAAPEGPAPLLQVSVGPQDPRDRVLRAYARATQAAQARAGGQVAPSLTLRGFLRQVQPVLGGVSAAYAKLTQAAETVLYSRADVGEPEATQAEALAKQTVEALARGTP